MSPPVVLLISLTTQAIPPAAPCCPLQIQYLATRPSMRRRGFARTLLTAFHEAASRAAQPASPATGKEVPSWHAHAARVSTVAVEQSRRGFWLHLGYGFKTPTGQCPAAASHLQELDRHGMQCRLLHRHIGTVRRRCLHGCAWHNQLVHCVNVCRGLKAGCSCMLAPAWMALPSTP
jgi:GNAT superfamily N-acetyltransferase